MQLIFYLFIYSSNFLISVCLSLFKCKIVKIIATANYSVLGDINSEGIFM